MFILFIISPGPGIVPKTTDGVLINLLLKKKKKRDFPGGAMVKNLPANAGDMGSSPGPGGSHMLRSN